MAEDNSNQWYQRNGHHNSFHIPHNYSNSLTPNIST